VIGSPRAEEPLEAVGCHEEGGGHQSWIGKKKVLGASGEVSLQRVTQR